MFPETEGFLVAIQDQVIPTNNYKRFILKNLQQSDKCRYGCQDSETIQHVTGGCQAFAPTDYKERHDIAAKIIHQELAYKFKLIECKLQYYKYTPQCVLENDKYKLYWDRTVLTDQYIKQNRPDIIIVDKDAQKQEQIESEQPGVDDSNDQDTEIFGILITEMGRAYAEFDGTNPLERPPLPKLKSSRKLAVVLCQLNKQILPEYLAHSNCIEQLHTLIYCAAVATVRTLGVKMPTQKITENSVKPITPKWEKRLERRTAEIRRDIGRLTQFTRGITTRKVRKQAMEIMQRLHHHSHQDATNINEWQCLDTLKQKLSVYTQRLKRYKASSHRKHDNALFQRSEKAFYRKLSSEPQEKSKTVPTKDQVEEFWGKQFGSTAYYNKCAGWITDEEAKSHYCNPMQYRAYTKQEIVDIDQVIPTNNYKRFILKNLQQSDKCRYGCQDSETIQHVTGGCQAFAPTDYKERHDIAAKIIHQELAYKFKLIECKLQYYKYTPQCVLENDKYKLYWDRTVLTDQYIKQNRPDIIIVDKDAQKVTLIDVAIPNSNNLTYKHNEKVAKYRELEFQIKRQWKMNNNNNYNNKNNNNDNNNNNYNTNNNNDNNNNNEARPDQMNDQMNNLRRRRWSKEENYEVMWAYYSAIASKIAAPKTRGTFEIWRNRNPNIMPEMNAQKLSNQRRVIERNLTEAERQEIKCGVYSYLHQQENEPTLPPATIESNKGELAENNNTPIATKNDELSENNDARWHAQGEAVELEKQILEKYHDVQATRIEHRKGIKKPKYGKHLTEDIRKANRALGKICRDRQLTITDLNHLIYASAAIIAGEEENNNSPRTKEGPEGPRWKMRLKNKISQIRQEISILSEINKGVVFSHVLNKADRIRAKYSHSSLGDLINTLKMKLQAKAQRLRRYTRRVDQYKQNRLFQANPKKFYRSLKEEVQVQEPPSKEDVDSFWRDILEQDKTKKLPGLSKKGETTAKLSPLNGMTIPKTKLRKSLGVCKIGKHQGQIRSVTSG
ncbi:unnamed protein product [Acanthoscelides obtectus]|uniref:Uncharacterized protein n=1 Tax=Acanthoscelides obtectus TaxID=200917 RepID=A0A9P0QCN3_ACAOB|nr:unnamed protein product [Acanthoscelides obtectus]